MKHLLLILWVAGCAAPPAEEPAAPAPVEPTAVVENPHGEGDLVAPPTLAPDTRVRRRMDVDQLADSMETVTGFRWLDDQGNDRFEQLAETLGKPDYVDSNQEDLAPSLVFQKFLSDAANATCDHLMFAEAERAPAARTFFVHVEPTTIVEDAPEDSLLNLQYLLLRYHGRSVALDAPELARWIWLVESATFVTNNPKKGWHSVCVGLLTHPDFYTY